MKIGIFTDDYLPRIDGVVVMIEQYRKVLAELGHEVIVFCPEYGDDKTVKNIVRLKSFDPLPLTRDITRNISPNSEANKREIAKYKLDIVHTHTQSLSFILAYEYCRENSVPHVMTFHTNFHELVEYYPWTTFSGSIIGLTAIPVAVSRYSRMGNIIRYPLPTKKHTMKKIVEVAKLYAENVNHIVSISERNNEFIESLNSGTTVSLVKNGIDTKKYKKATHNNKRLRLVYSGRLSSEKRHDVVIRALSKVDDMELVIVGDGQEKARLIRLTEELSLVDRVRFLGKLEHDALINELSKCDIGVLASYRFDNNPLVLMEYLAAGLPVLYCDDNFSQTVSDGCSIFAAYDVKGFVQALESFKKSDIKLMSDEAIRMSKNNDIHDKTKELERVYKKVIAKSD